MSLHRACCCDAISLTCPTAVFSCPGGTISAGLWCGCNAFAPSASGRWGLCYIDDTYPGLSKSNPGYLLERIAENQFRYEEAEVRKMEMDYTPAGGGNDSYTIRGYLWESGAWVLKRTLGPTAFGNDVRIGGYKAGTFSFGSFQLWAIDEWTPQTIELELFGVTACGSCADSAVQYNGNSYRTRVSSLNLAKGTLDRGENSSSFICQYQGSIGTVTVKLYDNFSDCDNDVNVQHEVTVPVNALLFLSADKNITIESLSVFDSGTGNTVFTGTSSGAAASLYNRAGDSVSGITNDEDCSGFSKGHSDSGTATVTIPPYGS